MPDPDIDVAMTRRLADVARLSKFRDAPFAEWEPSSGYLWGFVEAELTALIVGDAQEARLFADRLPGLYELVVRDRLWTHAHPNPDSPEQREREARAHLRGEAESLEWLCLGRWLIGEPWDARSMARAAHLEAQGCGDRLDPAGPWNTMQMMVNGGQAATAVALYDRCTPARKHQPTPPANGRFVAGQANAMYIIARYVSGDAGLADWAQKASAFWMRRTQQWHIWDANFSNRERLHWLRLWQAHFGGPQDTMELIAAVRPK